MKRSLKAFSLIELLIVVAIIGILAAIALPRFQDAQLWAKVAQSYSNLKALDTSIQQLQTDRGVMLVDIYDGSFEWGKKRIDTIFYGVGAGEISHRNQLSALAPLTSPIPYINHIPHDPFLYAYIKSTRFEWAEHHNLTIDNGSAFGNMQPVLHYRYTDNDPEELREHKELILFRRLDSNGIDFTNQDAQIRLSKGEYFIQGAGPKQRYRSNTNQYDFARYVSIPVVYNVSNGVISDGVLVLVPG